MGTPRSRLVGPCALLLLAAAGALAKDILIKVIEDWQSGVPASAHPTSLAAAAPPASSCVALHPRPF